MASKHVTQKCELKTDLSEVDTLQYKKIFCITQMYMIFIPTAKTIGEAQTDFQIVPDQSEASFRNLSLMPPLSGDLCWQRTNVPTPTTTMDDYISNRATLRISDPQSTDRIPYVTSFYLNQNRDRLYLSDVKFSSDNKKGALMELAHLDCISYLNTTFNYCH